MSDMVKQLRERRARLWEQMKGVAENAALENRALTESEDREWNRLKGEVASLDGRIEQMREGEERDRSREEQLAGFGFAGGNRAAISDPDVEERFRRAIYDKSPAPIELYPGSRRSMYQPGIEQRTLLKSSPTQALPVNVYDRIVQHLVENSAIMAAGATVINTETGEDLQVPASSAFVSSSLTAEGAAITPSDPTLGVSTLKAYKYASLFQVSRELATDSQSDVLGFLARSAAVSLALAFGPHLVNGTGSNQPQGVITGATQTFTGPTGTATSLGAQATAGQGTDVLYKLIGTLAEPYARQASTGFVMRNASLGIARLLKDSTGQPVAAATMNGAASGFSSYAPAANQLLGYPVHIDPSVPAMAANALSIVFGDWSRYFVRVAGGIRFERSDDYAFNSDLVTFRCVIRLDGRLVDPLGVVLFKNSAT